MTDLFPTRRRGLLAELALRYERRWLSRRFIRKFGHRPDIDRPRTYNERVIHRLVHDRDRRLNILCDKIATKAFVAERVGSRYVVPLLGKWADPARIEWDKLPDRFVLKPNQTSGPVALVHGPEEKDPELLTGLAQRWFRRRVLHDLRVEWGYRDVPRFIMAEPLLVGPEGAVATEVNVFVMAGKARLIRLFRGRKKHIDRRDAWFDPSGRQVAISVNGIRGIRMDLPEATRLEAIDVAEKLAEGFDQLRVDLFITDGGLKVGELTAYSWGGLAEWEPRELDATMTALWQADPDYSVFPDFIDPDLAEVRPADPLTWLETWQRLINAEDYEGARHLFASDVIAFGSLAQTMAGIDELEHAQWRQIWQTTRNFRFELPVIRPGAEQCFTIAVRWASEGRTETGGWYDRHGRATLLLERAANGDLLCTHSHFSMDPGIPARRT